MMKMKMSVRIVALQQGTWAKSGAQRPHYPFIGKPGMYVDLKDSSYPLEYSELFCTVEIVDVIARETKYAQKFLEKTHDLKLRSRTCHWKETNRNETAKFPAFFLLQVPHQTPDIKRYFSWKKILETPMFLDLYSEKRFHLLPKFIHFVDDKSYDETYAVLKDFINSNHTGSVKCKI
jgi:hypothetical protein